MYRWRVELDFFKGAIHAEGDSNCFWGLLPVSFVVAQTPQPTCKDCPATYIPKQELDAYIERAIANNLLDQQVRAVDIGKINVDIGIVYRGKLMEPAPDSAAEHDKVSELYHIIDGSGTLVTAPIWSTRSQDRPTRIPSNS